MTLFSLVFALLFEQVRPLSEAPLSFVGGYFGWLKTHLTTGDRRHGMIAWALAVIPASLAVLIASAVFCRLNPFLDFAWNVFILYLIMGFRQFSHAFTGVEKALKEGDVQRARDHIGSWRKRSAQELSSSEIARVSIEQGLVFSHKHVFGVIFWFILFGPAGAVFYRLSTLLKESWEKEEEILGKIAVWAHDIIDWLPSRLTAVSFAIVGDFEDALYCWRSQALTWEPVSEGILLSSGAGAMGVRLGDQLADEGYRPPLGMGDEADLLYMQSAVGLIWRALVLWLLLILLFTIASWVG